MTRGIVLSRLLLALSVVATACCLSACSSSPEGMNIGAGSANGKGSTSSGTGSSPSSNNSGINLNPTRDGGAGEGCEKGGDCYTVVDAGPYCGDKNIDTALSEDCDDGNRVGGDGCSGICKVEPNWQCPTPGAPCESLIVCGNGERQTGEGCDDGNKNPDDGCDPECKVESGWFCAGGDTPCQRLAGCGDGRIAPGESCDLGSDKNGKGQGCDAKCRPEDGWTCRPLPVGCKKVSVCGNTKVETGEDCDDGNTDSDDGCNGLCKIEGNYYECPAKGGACKDKSGCGNGRLEKQETCDDGNTNPDDGCSATCTLEDGWQCRMAGKACVALCGDGKKTGPEACDDSNTDSDDGCSSTCTQEPGAACEGSPSQCVKSKCGNEKTEAGESCDAGNLNGLFYGDPKNPGCSKTCTKEPACRKDGVTGPCEKVCGDGNREEGEACDDGNQSDGDGCTAKCEAEDGFTCEDQEVSDAAPCPSDESLQCLVLPVIYRDFDSAKESGGHPDFFYLGATGPDGKKTICVPNASGKQQAVSADKCSSSDSTDKCLGLVKDTLGPEGKPQANTSRSDGLKCACRFTDWDGTGIISGTGVTSCWDDGGNERKRVGYDTELMVQVIKDEASFKQWYTDSDKATTVKGTLELANTSGSLYQFSSSTPEAEAGAEGRTVYDDIHDIFLGDATKLTSGFFPLEKTDREKVCNIWPYWIDTMQTDAKCKAVEGGDVGSQWDPEEAQPVEPVQGMMRNFYFTTEVRYLFRYDGKAGKLAFFGDDDVWVFINGKLALDLGAPHERLEGTAPVDSKWGLTAGKTYEIAIFHADRHPRESNYQLTLSGFSTIQSLCQPTCGDGKATAGEECDNGAENQDGLYDGCTSKCKFGPFCGDGDKNGEEECDDGKNTTITASASSEACAPGCKLPPRCGDGVTQTGEECDDGASNTDQQCGGCSPTCKANAICGDGHVDEECGEECDDGANIGGYSYCKEGCVPDARCGDAVVDTEYGETCDLGDEKNGVADDSGAVGCTSTCGVPAVCGDKVVTPPETCDDGVNDGTYGGCTPDCQHAPYCGDGVKNGPEECDYGEANSPLNNALYGGCLENCMLGPRCGDSKTQSPPEQCDTGKESASCTANCIGKLI